MLLPARLAFVAVMIAVGIFTVVRAQIRTTPIPSPVVLSGADIGFRVTGMNGNTPAGEMVIRINGQWVVPKLGGGDAIPRPSSK